MKSPIAIHTTTRGALRARARVDILRHKKVLYREGACISVYPSQDGVNFYHMTKSGQVVIPGVALEILGKVE